MTEVQKLREALKPFADAGEELRGDGGSSDVVVYRTGEGYLKRQGKKVTKADLIEAAMVLYGK